MSKLLNVIRKELRELMNIESIMSIVVVLMIFIGLGFMIGQQTESASEPPVFGLLNLDDESDNEFSLVTIDVLKGFYGEMSEEELSRHIVMLSAEGTVEDREWLIEKMTELNLSSTLVIDNKFTQNIRNHEQGTIRTYYITEGAGMMSGVGSEILSGLVERISAMFSKGHLGQEYEFLTEPVTIDKGSSYTYINGKFVAGKTPMDISNALMSQTFMIPIVIMIVIMVVGSIVISSMGNEKENKTLETLLTLPVKRTTIVSGKILASAIMGLVYGGVYMLGMYAYIGSLTAGAGDVSLSEIGMVMGPMEWAVTMLVMFVTIMCALGLCMILGAFVKSYKGAQTMTLPISVLAMIPMFVLIISDWSTLGPMMQAIMFAIPFSHPMMVMQNLLFGNVMLVLAGLAYNTVFALVTILITVRLYNSDILLIGLGSTRIGKLLAKFKKTE